MTNPLVALFPGQGSQSVGMAKAFHTEFAVARRVFEEASEAIKVDLKKLCFEGPESDLKLTENTQPCLLTASIAAFEVAKSELGFQPAAVAGHSLGEYSALVAAQALPLALAVKWVRERGTAMQRAVPVGEGGMAAVMGLKDDQVIKLCEVATEATVAKREADPTHKFTVPAVVQPANYNSPGQVVIAGSADAVALAIEMIKTGPDFAGGKAILLPVSAPFHCSLMSPARKKMANVFSDVSPKTVPFALACPYIPNRTARITKESSVILDLLAQQIDHPVLWKQSVVTLIENGYTAAVEFGPGSVLQGLLKRIQTTDSSSSGSGLGMKGYGFGDPSALRVIEKLFEEQAQSSADQQASSSFGAGAPQGA